MIRDLFTVAEAAGQLGLNPSTVRWQVKNGAIEAIKLSPRVVLISAEEVERYRQEHLGTRKKQERTMYTTITDLYTAYCALFGSSTPVWTRDELRDWKNRLGKRYEDITADDLGQAYDESINED